MEANSWQAIRVLSPEKVLENENYLLWNEWSSQGELSGCLGQPLENQKHTTVETSRMWNPLVHTFKSTRKTTEAQVSDCVILPTLCLLFGSAVLTERWEGSSWEFPPCCWRSFLHYFFKQKMNGVFKEECRRQLSLRRSCPQESLPPVPVPQEVKCTVLSFQSEAAPRSLRSYHGGLQAAALQRLQKQGSHTTLADTDGGPHPWVSSNERSYKKVVLPAFTPILSSWIMVYFISPPPHNSDNRFVKCRKIIRASMQN